MKNHSHIISATQASRSLSDILNKVHYQGDSYEIRRGKTVIAKIIPFAPKKKTLPISELGRLLHGLPDMENEDRKDFAKDIQHIRKQLKSRGNPWD